MISFPQHRPVTLARRGMVAAPHYLAAEAGLELLKTGGNAIDAAIAASATLQVVYPFVCGLGGDVFMLIYDAKSGELYGLNGSGRSAQIASIERYSPLDQACRLPWQLEVKGQSSIAPGMRTFYPMVLFHRSVQLPASLHWRARCGLSRRQVPRHFIMGRSRTR